MPFARIEDKGTTFYYTDSGAPPGVPEYTTIVLIHGATINSNIFERMFPHASKYGLRFISMNSRDYAGSTPYTDDEIAEFASSDVNVQVSALHNLGREFGAFMVFVCTSLGIPATTVRDGQTRGGLALLTWSFSTIGLLSIFGDPETLDDEQKSILQPYLRTAFVFDPPTTLYGDTSHVGLLTPVDDPAVRDEDKPMAFMAWVSGYYTATPDIEHITPDALRNCVEEHPPTLHTMSSDDFERIAEPYNLPRSCFAILTIPPSVREEHFRRTFLDADAVLPDVKTVALWCDRSVWITLWSARALDELLQEGPVPGQRKRETSLVKIENANHFFHWDEPEKFVQILQDNL